MFKELIGSSRAEVAYVATQKGIFTETGTWFAATEESIKRYAAGVLAVRPLSRLLADADVWLRSPMIAALWSLLVFLMVLPPVVALMAALTMYVGWGIVGPSFVSRMGARLFRLLDMVLLQALAYIVLLSLLAGAGAMGGVWIGLGGFIALRWGIVQRLVDPLLRPIHRSLYALPVPDQILRAFIVRTALKHRIDVPQIREIERSIRDKWK